MKDRALRRHQDIRVKLKNQKNYNSCIGDLPYSERQKFENKIEKLKKITRWKYEEKKGRERFRRLTKMYSGMILKKIETPLII